MKVVFLALPVLPDSAVFAEPISQQNALQFFRHAEGWRCKTRMFSGLNLPDELEMVEKLQQASVWCSHHPGCYGVQFYNAEPEEDYLYCLKWCGQPQWCLAPILEEDSQELNVDEVVQDKSFYLFVKPPHGSYSMAQPLRGQPARCSYAGRVAPCFDPSAREACKPRMFGRGERAFVFAHDLQRRPEWLDRLEDSYLPYLQKTWAEPNGIDLVLILPAEDIAQHPISGAQRSALKQLGIQVREVSWIRPEMGEGIPRWARDGWCVSQDFFKLHALGLEYDAIIFYDTDMCLAAPRTVPQF